MKLRVWTRALLAGCGLLLGAPGAAADTLRYGVLADFPPYQVWREGAEPGGADLELLRQLAHRLGIAVQPLRYTDYPALEADLRAGRIDIASSMARTAARSGAMAFTVPYTTVKQALVTRAADPAAALTPDLGGRSIAVVLGSANADNADQLFPLASRVVVRSVEEAVDAVAAGRADALLQALPVVVDAIERRRHTGLRIARTFDLPTGALHFALAPAQQETARALGDLIGVLGAPRIDAIVAAWSVQPQLTRVAAALELDTAERTLLARLPPLTVAVVGDDRPFAFVPDGAAAPVGLSVDLLAAALGRLGLPPPRWRVLDAGQRVEGDADLVLGVADTPLAARTLRFAGPLMEHPMVLIGQRDQAAFELSLLQGRRLALPPDHFAQSLIDSRHPGIELTPCAALVACIDAVARGDAAATLADVVSAAIRLAERPRADLLISGAVPQLRRSHMVGVALRHAALLPLLQRSLDATLAADLPEVKARWLGRPAPAEIARRVALQAAPWIIGALLVLLALWWLHSRRLRGEVRRTRAAQHTAETARAASERFVTFLAHEVRNSLHSVIAGAELLRSARQVTPSVVGSLGESARSTLRLLNNLLDRDRLQAGRLALRLEPARLDAALKSVAVEMLPAALAKKLALRHQPAAHDPLLLIDAMRVQQVVRNLVANAIKYSSEGEIVIDSRCERLPGTPVLAGLEVRVSDQGPGMDAAQPADPLAESSGLGLALCRDLARLMDGEIVLDSRSGAGTTATLRWRAPLAEDERAIPPTAAEPAGRRQRILVVEDAEVYALLLERALSAEGHAVAVAGSVGAACEALRRDAFDLVVTDLNLADGDAHAVLALAREQAGAPAIAVMSAEIDAATGALLRAAGARVALTKIADVALFARQLLQHPALQPGRLAPAPAGD